jgi:hypothetical protein
MKSKKDTPVIELLRVVWRNTNTIWGNSYRKTNKAMRSALNIAIESGFRFAENDFKDISESFKFGYWSGTNGAEMLAEEYYTFAVEQNNTSACISLEKWKNRKPFLFNDVTQVKDLNSKKRRLALGSEFLWDIWDNLKKPKRDCIVRITNIDDKRIIACSYGKDDKNGYRGKIKKRYTITQQDLNAEMAKRKEYLEKIVADRKAAEEQK